MTPNSSRIFEGWSRLRGDLAARPVIVRHQHAIRSRLGHIRGHAHSSSTDCLPRAHVERRIAWHFLQVTPSGVAVAIR